MTPCLSPEADVLLHQRLITNAQFRTYSNAFACAFELPLFLVSGSSLHVSCADKRVPFCMQAEPMDGYCGRCPFRKLPPLEKLEPWVWSMKCVAGLDVTAAPLRSGSLRYAWLVTGHHAAGSAAPGCDFSEALSEAGIPHRRHAVMREAASKVPVISRMREDLLNQYLELMGAVLGAEVNAILTSLSDKDSCRTAELKRHIAEGRMLPRGPLDPQVEMAFPREAGVHPAEFLQRVRIEAARREIMMGGGSEVEIKDAARRAGCWDYSEFRKLFQRFFGEAPAEHYRRMTRVHSLLWDITRRN